MASSKEMGTEQVVRYYDRTQFMYSWFWSREALHYGLWDAGTRRLSQAVRNTNRYICDCLEIDAADRVLDAGCGVGGVSLYLAERTGARVTGINLSEKQLRIARRRAARSKARDRLDFQRCDFTLTRFDDGAYSKLFGIESVCHAFDKLAFLKEAYRILGTGGRIAVVDGFLNRTDLSDPERKIYRRFMEGWAVPHLATVDEFRGYMQQAGFENVSYTDKLESVRKSVRRIYLLGIAAYPLTYLLSTLGIVPEEIHRHTATAVAQKSVTELSIVTYGVFVGKKR